MYLDKSTNVEFEPKYLSPSELNFLIDEVRYNSSMFINSTRDKITDHIRHIYIKKFEIDISGSIDSLNERYARH